MSKGINVTFFFFFPFRIVKDHIQSFEFAFIPKKVTQLDTFLDKVCSSWQLENTVIQPY